MSYSSNTSHPLLEAKAAPKLIELQYRSLTLLEVTLQYTPQLPMIYTRDQYISYAYLELLRIHYISEYDKERLEGCFLVVINVFPLINKPCSVLLLSQKSLLFQQWSPSTRSRALITAEPMSHI